jgi:hypothetical protein
VFVVGDETLRRRKGEKEKGKEAKRKISSYRSSGELAKPQWSYRSEAMI